MGAEGVAELLPLSASADRLDGVVPPTLMQASPSSRPARSRLERPVNPRCALAACRGFAAALSSPAGPVGGNGSFGSIIHGALLLSGVPLQLRRQIDGEAFREALHVAKVLLLRNITVRVTEHLRRR